jgi:hypothetical protein
MMIRRFGPGPAAGMPDDRGFAEVYGTDWCGLLTLTVRTTDYPSQRFGCFLHASVHASDSPFPFCS